jgi:RND family efflux transporter MFP subunit
MDALRPTTAWLGLVLGLMAALAAPGQVSAQQDGALVRVDRVISQPLSQTVPVLGRLVPRQAGLVSAQVEAAVESFQVEVGDRVTEGQVLAILDAARLKARRDQETGQLSEAKAKLSTTKAQLTLARQELERLEGLKKSAAFSQGRYDDAHQNVAIYEAQVAESQAGVVTAQADLELTEINVEDATIVAPYDGVIIQRMTETGAYVKVGDALVRIIAVESLEIEADVPYLRLSGLTPGVTIAVTLDDGTAHEAVVRAIVPEENPLTRTRAVRFSPEFNQTNQPLAARLLAADQSVTVHVPVGASRVVLSVHKDAVIKQGDSAMVFIANGEVAEPREITLGEAVGSRYEVLTGLEEGELVVVRGNERLRPGDKVRIDGAS